MKRGYEETWEYIEHLLVEECGLKIDEGLASERSNCINAIKNAMPDPKVIDAAIEFLNQGDGLHRIRVNGKMMDRKQVAVALCNRGPFSLISQEP